MSKLQIVHFTLILRVNRTDLTNFKNTNLSFNAGSQLPQEFKQKSIKSIFKSKPISKAHRRNKTQFENINLKEFMRFKNNEISPHVSTIDHDESRFLKNIKEAEKIHHKLSSIYKRTPAATK